MKSLELISVQVLSVEVLSDLHEGRGCLFNFWYITFFVVIVVVVFPSQRASLTLTDRHQGHF